jgi:3-methyladenine DNA glycosylase AlkC
MALTPEEIIAQVHGKSIRTMRHVCFEISRKLTPEETFKLVNLLYINSDTNGAMAATLLAGHISYILPEALSFLRDKSATHPDIRVQDCLSRAFDHYCLNRGFERAMPVMQEWARDPNEFVRRAVIEANRPWSRKEYFQRYPDKAVAFISQLKADPSGTVRFSVGRALSEVGKDFPEKVVKELGNWNINNPSIKHTYMFAAKDLQNEMGSLFTARPQEV